MDRVKAVLRAIALYLQENPGTATLVGGWVVLALAHVGLHVNISQLYAIAVILMPLIAGGHLAARRARAKRGRHAADNRIDVALAHHEMVLHGPGDPTLHS